MPVYLGDKKIGSVVMPPETKYGLTVNDFIGDVTNGTLGRTGLPLEMVFPGVKTIDDYAMAMAFAYRVFLPTNGRVISFPDLETVGKYGLCQTFYYAFSQIGEGFGVLSFPKLKTIDDRGFEKFAQQVLAGYFEISFPELETVGYYGFSNALASIKTQDIVSFPKLKTVGRYGLEAAFKGNTTLQVCNFPVLDTVQSNSFGVGSTSMAFYNCKSLREIHFMAGTEDIISTMSGYSTSWGGTYVNDAGETVPSQIIFDL